MQYVCIYILENNMKPKLKYRGGKSKEIPQLEKKAE